jgi:hypothetical protein
MAYTVARADVASAEETLVRLWAANLKARREKYGWFYRHNPGGPTAAFLLRTDTEGGATVGCAGAGIRRFHAASGPLRGALLVDFAVHREHRSLLPALRLQRAMSEWARDNADFAYGFPSASAEGVFRRLGYREGSIRRYLRILRHGPYVARLLGSGPAVRVLAAALDAGSSLSERFRRRGETTRLEWSLEPDARSDRLWETARAAYPIIGDRSAPFLRWRFAEQPGPRVRFATMVEPASGEVRGYAAVADDQGGVARLEDFLAPGMDDLGRLLQALVAELRRQGFRAVETEFAGSRWVAETLAAQGFVARDARPVMIAPGPSWRAGAPLDLDDWYLTAADSDT